jgi:asparagine synthase (glutamine-hydrolysing)
MSAQFGQWNLDGQPVDALFLGRVKPILEPYGPDKTDFHVGDGLAFLYCALHTTKESRQEAQPYHLPSGSILMWDGRLDNRSDLLLALDDGHAPASTDVSIVAAAFHRWGTKCVPRLLGDWALSLWNPSDNTLILARDFIGTRPLYYVCDGNHVIWSTLLDPLVLLAGRSFELNEEYLAGWLSSLPAAHLTPYRGIHSVPPASSIVFGRTARAVETYWKADPVRRIAYRSDAEYEEHFRIVFANSVRRRLRADKPVLAELSGGMDSSSIVCIADRVLREVQAEAPRLDTVSFYSRFEPNWDEQPYFTKVEESRGRAGCHIELDPNDLFDIDFAQHEFAATPAALTHATPARKQFANCIVTQKSRVLLSGVGGDELLGGVPAFRPGLADLAVQGRWIAFVREATRWAVALRKPFYQILADVLARFLPRALRKVSEDNRPAPWLRAGFVARNKPEFHHCSEGRFRIFVLLPSFHENINALEALARQLTNTPLPLAPPHEKRYPYLDRELVEFLLAIPREQVVRPGQRRSLMRRAMRGIVPEAILNRRRKAYVARGPATFFAASRSQLAAWSHNMVSDSVGIVDHVAFLRILESLREAQQVPLIPLLRTFGLEKWLRTLKALDLLSLGRGPLEDPFSALPKTVSVKAGSISQLGTIQQERR